MASSWTLPPVVQAAANQQNVRYDEAPPWPASIPYSPPPYCVTSPSCSGTYLPGARALGAYLLQYFPGVASIEGYCCRPNTGATSLTTIHGVGRAIDVMFPEQNGEANPLGDLVANWLVMHAQAIGVQHIIWNHTSWVASGRHLAVPYHGPNPHTSHVHVELNQDGADKRTPWFTSGGPDQAPDLGALGYSGALAWLRRAPRTVPGKVLLTALAVGGATAAGWGLAEAWTRRGRLRLPR